MYASNIDRNGKTHKGKYVSTGKCVFPFRHKNKLQNECVDTGKGLWCATSTKKRNAVDKWGYCVSESVSKGASNLQRLRNANSKLASEALLMMSNKQKRTNKRSNKKKTNRRKRTNRRRHSNRQNKRK